MSPKYSGTCLCEDEGGIRFTISAEPIDPVCTCYCTHCSKGAGGIGQVMVAFPQDSIKIESGEDRITTFTFEATDSGKPKDKMFCKVCGVTLWTAPDHWKKLRQLLVRTPVIDGRLDWKPTVELTSNWRAKWTSLIAGAAQQ
ncbi:Mss4-like protein [Apiosordaria backusii]|uniref:Mss4-like protein n=1 Tax=Apiosordaria backusii TaxID=314023 RepID=A0AA40B2M9_9PEZI|nr:Mss4-like protein [Apiosordaria backusii]